MLKKLDSNLVIAVLTAVGMIAWRPGYLLASQLFVAAALISLLPVFFCVLFRRKVR